MKNEYLKLKKEEKKTLFERFISEGLQCVIMGVWWGSLEESQILSETNILYGVYPNFKRINCIGLLWYHS